MIVLLHAVHGGVVVIGLAGFRWLSRAALELAAVVAEARTRWAPIPAGRP